MLAFLIIFVLLAACNTAKEGNEILKVELSTTVPVAWNIEIQDKHIRKKLNLGEAEVDHLAKVRLNFTNLPPGEEGNSYTLIGGGLNETGLHGPNSTGFEGPGIHFADPKGLTSENTSKDIAYLDDYSRIVRDGQISFDIYYEPTNITEWGEPYFPGTELALTLMRSGTSDRVLYAADNELNWAIAGVGKGNSADITIDMAVAEYTWHMEL